MAMASFPDPLTRKDRGSRSPELKEWKLSKLSIESVPEFWRYGITVGQFSPIRTIDRPRCHRPVHISGHVIPPEIVCTGERRIARSWQRARSFPIGQAYSTAARTRSLPGLGNTSHWLQCHVLKAFFRSGRSIEPDRLRQG